MISNKLKKSLSLGLALTMMTSSVAMAADIENARKRVEEIKTEIEHVNDDDLKGSLRKSLDRIEVMLGELENKDKEDKAKAEAVEKLITELPKLEDLKIEDKVKVEEARKAYEALSIDQKRLVSKENVESLEALEEKIKELEAKPEEPKENKILENIALEKLENNGTPTNWKDINTLTQEDNVVTGDFTGVEEVVTTHIYNKLGSKIVDGKVGEKDAEEYAIDSYVMNTLARYLGAIHRVDTGSTVQSITFGKVTYTWNGDKKGSNWVNEDKTLVAAIVDAQENRAIREVKLTLNGEGEVSQEIVFKATNVPATLNIEKPDEPKENKILENIALGKLNNNGTPTNWKDIKTLTQEDNVVTGDFTGVEEVVTTHIYNKLGSKNVDGKVGEKDAEEYAIDSYVMNTLARYLGAIHRVDNGSTVKSITFGEVRYTWNGDKKGSNWVNEDKTLVAAIVDAQENRAIREVKLTLNGEGEVSQEIVFNATNVPTTLNLTTAKVSSEEELKAAIENNSIKTIELSNDIKITSKINISTEKTIDGKDFTISGNNADGWNSLYLLHFYNTKGGVKNLTLKNGDAGILVNGSDVTAENISISNMEFGGIEVSKGEGVTKDPKLTIGSNNFDLKKTIPAIWIDGYSDLEKGVVEYTGSGAFKESHVIKVDEVVKDQLWFTNDFIADDSIVKYQEKLVIENNAIKKDDVKFMVQGLYKDETTSQKPSSLNEVAEFMNDTKKITFNKEAITIEDGKITVSERILKPSDWKTVKEGGDSSIPYKITILLDGNKANKLAKIVIYEDGLVEIEDLKLKIQEKANMYLSDVEDDKKMIEDYKKLPDNLKDEKTNEVIQQLEDKITEIDKIVDVFMLDVEAAITDQNVEKGKELIKHYSDEMRYDAKEVISKDSDKLGRLLELGKISK